MDVLDRLLGHDAWTTRQLLLRCRPLADAQLDREFAIGHGSLRATFAHVIWNVEAWTDDLCRRPLRPRPGPGDSSVERLVERHDAAAAEFAAAARRAREEGRLDECYVDGVDGQTKSLGGVIAHVITHSMHHRAQVLNMMRHLGMTDLIEGDVLSWEAACGRGD
jgi:uncharacterized damage-inducible protein DinB